MLILLVIMACASGVSFVGCTILTVRATLRQQRINRQRCDSLTVDDLNQAYRKELINEIRT